MSGAGAGSGVGFGGMLPELPHNDPADRPRQWSEALRDVAVVKADNVTTAAVALDLNAPALLGAAFPRPGIVPEQMAAEGLDEHPVGLTEPTPSIDRMAPVEASVAGQDAGPGDLRSPLMPSAALQFGALPRVANNGGAGLAGSTVTPAASVWASASPAADAASMRLAFPAAGLDSQAAAAGLASAFLAGAPRSLPASGLPPTPGHSAAVERNGLSGPAATGVASVGRRSSEVMPAGLASFGRAVGGTTETGGVPVEREAGGTAESKVAPVEPGSSEAAQTLTREASSPFVDRGGAAATPDAGRTDAAVANAPLVGGASHRAGTLAQATMPGLGLVAGGLAAAAAIALPGQIPGLGRAVLLRHAADSTTGDPHVVSYSERREVPIDLAPVSAEVPAWRLDDTQTLATVGPEGASAAALDAAGLYQCLMERGGGLAAIQPGQGFASWEGSPLWLSLAGIPKPARMGVLATSAPGRVQVMRTEHGEWLVEHVGGPWPAPIALRHDATAGDDQSLLLDVLYGIGSAPPETPALHRFEAATTMLRLARGATGPAGWRSQEAWAMVARCCAVAAVQPGQDALPQAEAALARAMQATVSAVMDGLAPAVDPLTIAPLDRDRFVAVVRSGDPVRLAAGLRGLGHATLAQLRQGKADGVGPIELLALAACLGRLTREAASFPSPHREVPRFPVKQPEAAQLALHPRLSAAETMAPWRRQ